MKVNFQNHNQADYERLFNELMLTAFGCSFAAWHQKRLWTESYESYSIIEDGRMLANICLFKTDLVIFEHKLRAGQLGAVATHPEHRGRGLSGSLMKYILQLYPTLPMFLFANSSVLEYYPRFGFKRIFESRPRLEIEFSQAENSARRLSSSDPLIQNYLANARQLSKLYCSNGRSVEWFHFLISYADHIYHLPGSEALVIAVEEGEEIFIPYLNAPAGAGPKILRGLPFKGRKTLRFGFTPDQKLCSFHWEIETSDDEAMFVRGAFPFPEIFAFPAMSKT